MMDETTPVAAPETPVVEEEVVATPAPEAAPEAVPEVVAPETPAA